MLDYQGNPNGLTVDKCKKACHDKNPGYRYAAVECSSACTCGNDFNYAVPCDGCCDMACGGNTNEKCGGWWAANVFELVREDEGKGRHGCVGGWKAGVGDGSSTGIHAYTGRGWGEGGSTYSS